MKSPTASQYWSAGRSAHQYQRLLVGTAASDPGLSALVSLSTVCCAVVRFCKTSWYRGMVGSWRPDRQRGVGVGCPELTQWCYTNGGYGTGQKDCHFRVEGGVALT